MKVTLDHVTKRFPNRNKKIREDVIAVNDFTFEIPDGKLIGLLGPSGCGKSTTLNLISGLEMPSAGRIYFGDTDVTDLPAENRGVGLVFQNYALYPHLTVEDNITFPLGNLRGAEKLTKAQMHEKAVEVAGLVQIGELMERRPSELSGGQQQRVAIARALVKMPSVLLLDEPLSNLDARLRLQTREELARIQRETGITTVFVTHDQEEAMSISDLIVVMKDGLFQQMGKPQDVYDHPDNLFVARFLGTPPINVFRGQIKDGSVVIGGETVLAADVSDDISGDVYVGIRPEGFLPSADGKFGLTLSKIEVMGRDTTVVATHPDLDGAAVIRAIIRSDEVSEVLSGSSSDDSDAGRIVRFDIRPEKVHLFDIATGHRIDAKLSAAARRRS
ncbi:MAG: ABC transporter ATP-binding protein [Lachnospiraceae bacterium]|nr:ABC transporter ATP-binding protein [Lachnospiraceae bacterium]